VEAINRQTLLALTDFPHGADGPAVRDFIALYVRDLKPRIQAMRDAFVCGDLKAVAAVARALFARSVLIGAPRLAASASSLERVCNGELGDIAVCFVRVIDDAAASIASLNRLADELDFKAA
jgi:hypothetical protein